MGDDLDTYRCRIGTFSQPCRCRSGAESLHVYRISMFIRIVLFFLLAIYCVETNPGPSNGATGIGAPTGRGSKSGSQRNQTRMNKNVSRESFGNNRCIDTVQSPPRTRHSQRHTDANQSNLNSWIHDARSDADLENEDCDSKTILLEIRNDIKCMNKKFDKMERSISNLEAENKALREQNELLNEKVESLTNTVSLLEKSSRQNELNCETLESQSRRNNLKFHGFKDERGETWDQSETKIRQYISDIGINETDIQIDRAHRLNSFSANRDRPIIVKFPFFKDRDKILRRFRELRKQDDFNGQTYGGIRVVEDFPERIRRQRTLLYPFLKQSLESNKSAYFSLDKLVIDGTVYVYDHVQKKPVVVK